MRYLQKQHLGGSLPFVFTEQGVIDDTTVYHFGASLKDLGKKWFSFSKMDKEAFKILERLNKIAIQ